MKQTFRVLAIVLGGLVVLAGLGATFIALRGIPSYEPGHVDLKVELTPERVLRGEKFVRILCAECHMNPTTRTLTGKRMLETPAEFGAVYSLNITQHPEQGIGRWTDGELAYLLRTGVARDGRYTPPYMAKLPHLSDEDLASIIAFLRSDHPLVAANATPPPGRSQPSFLVKFLTHVAFRPLPYPTRPIRAPEASDQLATGRYLVANLECWACHSADFKTMNVMEPEKSPGYLGGGNQLLDLAGRVVPSANITFDDKTGIGRWSAADFAKALREGVRPDGKPILYPMSVLPELSDAEVAAMYAYLKSVPQIENRVQRASPPAQVAAEEPGKALYYKYACYSCHGDDGIGNADLTRAREHFSDDASLNAWIADAPSVKPGTRMPRFRGLIAEQDLPLLAAYVRKLGDNRHAGRGAVGR